MPFEFSPPLFEDNSCTTRITVNLAVADIGSTSNPKIKQGRVNLWIPDNGSAYATQGLANGVEGIGEPQFIVINRDLTNNPIVAPCTGDAEITIEPTAAEINAKLGIPGYC